MNTIPDSLLYLQYDIEGLIKELEIRHQELKPSEIDEICTAIQSVLSNDFSGIWNAHKGTILCRGAGNGQIVCSPIVLAYAKESPRLRHEFSLLRAVESIVHVYKNCTGITRFGVLLTDVWRPSNFKFNEYDLRTFAQNGIKTIPILINGQSLRCVHFPWE